MSGCAKCGFEVLIHDVRVIAHGNGKGEQDLSLQVYRNPGALIFKRGVSGPLHATVCGSCGFAEFYVANPKELLNVAKETNPALGQQPPNPA